MRDDNVLFFQWFAVNANLSKPANPPAAAETLSAFRRSALPN
jgi:hypothetical protein